MRHCLPRPPHRVLFRALRDPNRVLQHQNSRAKLSLSPATIWGSFNRYQWSHRGSKVHRGPSKSNAPSRDTPEDPEERRSAGTAGELYKEWRAVLQSFDNHSDYVGRGRYGAGVGEEIYCWVPGTGSAAKVIVSWSLIVFWAYFALSCIALAFREKVEDMF